MSTLVVDSNAVKTSTPVYRRILVPIDGSVISKLGFREAVQLAADHGSLLRVIHVVDEMALAYGRHMLGMPAKAALVTSLRSAGRTILDEATAFARKHDVKIEALLLRSGGQPVSDVILHQTLSWGANLIVMGTHGRRGMNRLLLGSDAERVLRDAPVPVLLVRDTGSEKSARRKRV